MEKETKIFITVTAVLAVLVVLAFYNGMYIGHEAGYMRGVELMSNICTMTQQSNGSVIPF